MRRLPWYLSVRLRKAKSATKVSRQYEENYKTNLEWEKTLASLTLTGNMKVEPAGPPGIRHLRWKNTFCAFGRQGGLNIHSTSEEEMNEFILLLQSHGVYPDGQEPEWTLERSTHGKRWYKSKMKYYKQKYEALKSTKPKTEDAVVVPGHES